MLDIVIFIILLIYMWKGYEKTFSREVLDLGIISVSLIAGIIFYSIPALVLRATSLSAWIGGFTTDGFMKRVTNPELTNETVNQIFGAINTVENKEGMIGDLIVMFFSLIIIFVVVYAVLKYVLCKKKVYKKIRVAIQINPALGGLVGVVKGLLVVYVAIAFLVVSEPIIPSDFVKNQVDNSEIARAMYERNYIANIVARQDFLSSRD